MMRLSKPCYRKSYLETTMSLPCSSCVRWVRKGAVWSCGGSSPLGIPILRCGNGWPSWARLWEQWCKRDMSLLYNGCASIEHWCIYLFACSSLWFEACLHSSKAHTSSAAMRHPRVFPLQGCISWGVAGPEVAEPRWNYFGWVLVGGSLSHSWNSYLWDELASCFSFGRDPWETKADGSEACNSLRLGQCRANATDASHCRRSCVHFSCPHEIGFGRVFNLEHQDGTEEERSGGGCSIFVVQRPCPSA